MITPSIGTTSSGNGLEEIVKALEKLSKTKVLVGIPQEKSSRPGEPLTNAELCFIHTNGSPLRHIPARPIIEPAIKDDEETISFILGEALVQAMNGNMEQAMQKLNQAGLEGQGASQDWFTNSKNNWAPNSPYTAWMKRKKGSTDPKPLIDTGELRKSITYVIREE